MAAYLLAQMIDVQLFHFWKRRTRGRHLWLRNNGSTMVSQLVDSVTVNVIFLYKNPTVLGSSPKCEIYLFKDEAIEPKHAAIHTYGTRYEIEDMDTPAGTFVNGMRITRQPLKNGDRIYLGETVLDFSEREND